jgi:GAF domain-containing protein
MKEQNIPQINELIAIKFKKIEAALSSGGGIAELFEILLAEIETEFCVPFVWLSFIRRPETEILLKLLGESDILRDRLNVMDQSSFLEIVPDDSQPLLTNSHIKPFFRLMPPNRRYFIRSLAISPLFLHGRMIGSINHGDPSPERYHPEMDTTLLSNLARCVSERLTHLLSLEGKRGPFLHIIS